MRKLGQFAATAAGHAVQVLHRDDGVRERAAVSCWASMQLSARWRILPLGLQRDQGIQRL